MSSQPEVNAIYNLERTVVDHVHHKALYAMVKFGLAEIDKPDPEADSYMSVAEQRQRVLDALRDKTLPDLKEVLVHTVGQVESAIQPWALPLMTRHAEIGRTIALFSATVPQPFVKAYAEGLRSLLPSESKVAAYGKLLRKNKDVYTGQTYDMLKGKIAESLLERGQRIAFVADSFTSGGPVMKHADHTLRVNYSKETPTHRDDHISWNERTPYRVKAQEAFTRTQDVYDLSLEDHTTAFLRWLVRKDPEARDAGQ